MNSTSSQNARDTAASAAPQARKTTNDFLQAAGSAIDSGREYADDAFDKAESKVRGLRDSVDPMVDMLASRAQKLGRQTLDMAGEAKDRAQQSMNRAAHVTTRYVAEQPLRSVLIAAAVGAAVALLVSTARNRNRY